MSSFRLTISCRLLAKRFKVLLAFTGLILHTWQKEKLTVARTCVDRLSHSSVAMIDQRIGLFIYALWWVFVTSHWLVWPTTDLWQVSGCSLSLWPEGLVISLVADRSTHDTSSTSFMVIRFHGYPLAGTSPDLYACGMWKSPQIPYFFFTTFFSFSCCRLCISSLKV